MGLYRSFYKGVDHSNSCVNQTCLQTKSRRKWNRYRDWVLQKYGINNQWLAWKDDMGDEWDEHKHDLETMIFKLIQYYYNECRMN